MHGGCTTCQGFDLRQVCPGSCPSVFQPWIADLDSLSHIRWITVIWVVLLRIPSLLPNARQSDFKNFRNWRSFHNSSSLYMIWNCPCRTFYSLCNGSWTQEEELQLSSCLLTRHLRAFSPLFFRAILQLDLKMVANLFHVGKQPSWIHCKHRFMRSVQDLASQCVAASIAYILKATCDYFLPRYIV